MTDSMRLLVHSQQTSAGCLHSWVGFGAIKQRFKQVLQVPEPIARRAHAEPGPGSDDIQRSLGQCMYSMYRKHDQILFACSTTDYEEKGRDDE